MGGLFAALYLAVYCAAFPVSFEKRGSALFIARFSDGGVAEVRPDRVTVDYVTLRFAGAASARMEGLGGAAPATYFHAGSSRTFRQFPRVAIRGLYAGVDAIFYGNGKNLEYDLQLRSGVSVDRIRISVDGAIAIDRQGNLRSATRFGELQQMKPRVYQRGREIGAEYVLLGRNEVGLRLGTYDQRAPLTLDPVLAYTRTFGTTGPNSANLVATDAGGNIYVAGLTSGVDFPTSLNTSSFPPLWVLSNAD